MRYLFTIIIFTIFEPSSSLADELAYKSYHNIPYSDDTTSKYQTLDIYVPLNSDNKVLLPVHVFVHGGAWTKGDKARLTPKQIHNYTARDIILVSVNYRLGPRYRYPANIQDIERASKWLHNTIIHYGGNKNRMLLSGHSAGAHLVALAGVRESLNSVFRAIFCVDSASYDLTKKSIGAFSKWVEHQKYKTFGRKHQVLKEASPIFQISSEKNASSFYLYATHLRTDAVIEMKRFEKALNLNEHNVKAKIVNDDLSHAEMLDAMFDPNQIIYQSIITVLQQ